jgi:hypothetical protein
MTAVLNFPPDDRIRRMPGLVWVTWRQQRSALVATTALFAGLAVTLAVLGIHMHQEYAQLGLTTCGPLNGRSCQAPLAVFEQRYQAAAMYLPRFLEFLPAALGVFVGAPLVARELESGSYRFAWTQGRSRTTWILAKLVIVGPYLLAVTLVFSAVFAWWFRPWEQIMGRLSSGEAYEVTGVVFGARTLFAFVLGVALGATIRRTVPAMLATAAIWLAVAWPSVIYLRPLIERPVSVPSDSNSIASNAWAISNWWQNRAGQRLSSTGLDRLLAQAHRAGVEGSGAFQQFLVRHGWVQWSSFQPNDRFWHFQLVEAAGYVGLSLALAGAAVWWIARRAT